jgi:group I intron endonuclease
MKEYGRVYKITNILNNKSYVGITRKTLAERFEAHCNRANIEKSAVQKAIKKYGKENFTITEIDIAISKEDLFNKEIYWIKTLDTLKNGYNLTTGGEGIIEMTQEIKDKISKSKKGVPNPKLKGRIISVKQRLMISKKFNGKKVKLTNIKTGEEIILNWVNEARNYGLNPSNVVSVCKGIRKSTKGYLCSYLVNGNPDLIEDTNTSSAVQRIDSETQARI